MTRRYHYVFAKTKEELAELRALGWVTPSDYRDERGFKGTTMRWNRDGEPQLPARGNPIAV